jgi:hypothetical protein
MEWRWMEKEKRGEEINKLIIFKKYNPNRIKGYVSQGNLKKLINNRSK